MSTKCQQPVHGDLLVEVIGAEVRFWSILEGSARLRREATSFAFMRERVLRNDNMPPPDARPAGLEHFRPAADLTVAKLYKGSDDQTASLVWKYFPHVRSIHLYFSGCGPSGVRFGFHAESHRTVCGAP